MAVQIIKQEVDIYITNKKQDDEEATKKALAKLTTNN